MRPNPLAPFLFLLTAAFLATRLFCADDAYADDTYVTSLFPGADAGSTAPSDAGFGAGQQLMIRCDTYPGVTLRMCQAGAACTATSNDTRIDPDKSIDICTRTGIGQLSVFKQYDGGNPTCRLYVVNPKTVCPP
jgi:hypothetical protein